MLTKIKALKSDLRKSEQRVADTVLGDPEAAVKSSIAVLARQAAVSEPTVMRFCRALGCDGFQQFKLELAQDLAQRMRYAHQDISSSDSGVQLAEKVIDGTIAALLQLRRQLDEPTLRRAIHLLSTAARIEIYGLGGAGIVAADAQLKFSRLGIATLAYADAYIHNVAASLLKPGDVVVAISNSGRSKDLLRSTTLALEAGADVIALTAAGSPLARQATLALTLDMAADSDHYTPIKARIVPMVMIDILAIGVALERGPAVLGQLAGIRDILRDRFL
jgi:RpiR family carbohydrate utilization transcriptional regulator